MALQKRSTIADIKTKNASISISKAQIQQSLMALKRKEVKSNISIPIGPSLLKRYTLLSERVQVPRSELMRFALEYVLSNDEFLKELDELEVMAPAETDPED